VIASLSLSLIAYTFVIVNEKQMKMTEEIDRTKMLRIRANTGKKGMSILEERERQGLDKGRSIM
jgi:hypothetical protein